MVFTTEIGKHLDPRNALRGFVQLARVAGLPDGVGLHTLRHTAASTLIEAGAHMRAVQEVLGHEDATGRRHGSTRTSVSRNSGMRPTSSARRSTGDPVAVSVAVKP